MAPRRHEGPHALLKGKGAVGMTLTMPDGAASTIAFRTNADMKMVTCGGVSSGARVFAERRDKDGQSVCAFHYPTDLQRPPVGTDMYPE